MAEKKEGKKAVKVHSGFFIYLIIGVIIVTFVIGSGVMPGILDFFGEITKRTEKNSDGTIAIERMAQTKQNQGNPDTYIGKVLGKKIQLGRDDDFNRKYDSITKNKNFNGYQQYQYLRMIFEDEIEKIIGMYNAQKMGITVSNASILSTIVKRSYTDDNGKVNHEALRKDINKLNQGHTDEVRSELLFNNYEYDYFANLPVGYDEVKYQYQAENTKIAVKYVDIPFTSIKDNKINQFAKINDERFKQYKISKIIFSDNNKKDAEKALIDLINAPENFDSVSQTLRTENKIINVVKNDSYYVLDELDAGISMALKETKINNIANKLISEPNIGYVIVKLEDVKSADLSDNNLYTKIKEAYIAENKAEVESEISSLAYDIYESVANGTNIEQSAKSKGFTVSSSENDFTVNDNPINVLKADSDEDVVFKSSFFATSVKSVIKPYNYGEGFIIVYINSKSSPDLDALADSYEQVEKSISSNKTYNLKYDFYSAKKKEYKVVNNFDYVFSIQDFLN